MNENNRTEGTNDHNRREQDQPEELTTNEIIREVSGSPNTDLNEVSDAGHTTGSSTTGENTGNITHGGVNYTPQDMSAVRSGGITDMDDQAEGGAGQISGRIPGAGSDLTQKLGTTGSDFDGQNSTS